MLERCGKLGIAAALGTLVMAGTLAGCGVSSNHVDCNVVKLQQQAGRSDDEIASAIGASVSDVATCHGPEKSGNPSSGGAPGPY